MSDSIVSDAPIPGSGPEPDIWDMMMLDPSFP